MMILLAVLTVIAQLMILGGLTVFFSPELQIWLKKRFTFSLNHFILSAYLVAFIAMIGSLYFSDVAGFTPCKLCWYQRIVMYPQVFLYLLAVVLKDSNIKWYGLMLSIIGIVLAGYHYLLQIGILTTEACTTVGYSVSCSERFTTTFGYITIPLMAFSAFGLIIVIWMLEGKLLQQKNGTLSNLSKFMKALLRR